MPNFIRYAVKNNDGTFTYNTSYSSNIYGVGVDTSALASQGQGVVYTQGDRIRFYLTGLSIMPFDLEVIGQDGNYVITRPYNFGTTTSSSLLDMIVEYYTPYYQSGNEIFYTTSACYRVSAPGTDMRQYSTRLS